MSDDPVTCLNPDCSAEFVPPEDNYRCPACETPFPKSAGQSESAATPLPNRVPLSARKISDSAEAERLSERIRTSEAFLRLLEEADVEGPQQFDPNDRVTDSVLREETDEGYVVLVTDRITHDEHGEGDSETEASGESISDCPNCGTDISSMPTSSSGEINFCSNCGQKLDVDTTDDAEFTGYTQNTAMGYFDGASLESVALLHEFQRGPLYGRGIKFEYQGGSVVSRGIWVS